MLYLVRHGRTAANASGLLQGRLDPPLDEIGRKQATAIAKLVGPVDAVIASSLVRAQETAECFGLPVEVDDRWIELAYGEYEGVRTKDILRTRPGWLLFRDGCPGGESVAQVSDRADQIIARLKAHLAAAS